MAPFSSGAASWPHGSPHNSTWACGVRGPGEEESVGTPPANQGHRGRLPSCSDLFASLGLPWGRWASRQPWPPWDSWSPWSEGEQALPLQFTWWDTLLEWVGWSDCSDSGFHLQGSPGWAGPRGEPVSCSSSQRLPRALSAGWGPGVVERDWPVALRSDITLCSVLSSGRARTSRPKGGAGR